jgi:hypothetical protein
VHVDAFELALVARGLDQPGEVDDGVGAREVRPQVGLRNVGGDEARARVAPRRTAAGDADDLLDARVARKRFEDAGSHVSGGSGDDDSHVMNLPRRG